jgi:hypothetical protein
MDKKLVYVRVIIITELVQSHYQLDSVYDGGEGIGNLRDFRRTLETTLPELSSGLANLSNQVQETIGGLQNDLNTMERVKNGEMTKQEFLTAQERKANDPCIAAKKCNLQGHSRGKKGMTSEEGCCPGQNPPPSDS